MHGYLGQILRVDLTEGTLTPEPLNEAYARAYVGGSALAARYLYDAPLEGLDPLDPASPLIFMTGPLVGTAMPSAGRYSVCGLSPLTGKWGEANSGGFFGPELRFAGYDGLIITGRAARPVWLSIVAGEPALHDAAGLWGLDSYATQERVREALAEPRARVACIGPAGERQVRLAGVMNDHGRAAARGGLGALMGSKNLKAIGVRGSAAVPLADPDTFKAVARQAVANSQEDVAAMSLRLAGTAGYVDMALMYGDMPIRYWQQGEWEEASNLSGMLMSEQFQNCNTACYRCPIACGRETRAPAYGVDKTDGPEYETVAALGSLVMVNDLEAVIYAGHLCNLYGLDTISMGSAIALACELATRGLLTPEQAGGLELRYGDAALVHRLIELTARREGLGDLLAEGTAHLAAHCGAPELAVTVNGLDAPMHDPRAFSGMAVTYALSPRGACHMQGDMYGLDTGQGPALELGIEPGDRFDDTASKGVTAAKQQAWRTLYNALTLCQFQAPGVEPLRTAINAATGWELTANDLLPLGKRMLALKRLINQRRGLTRADDTLPMLQRRPLAGGTEGHVPDLETMLSGAYAELGWDANTALPTGQMVRTLGL